MYFVWDDHRSLGDEDLDELADECADLKDEEEDCVDEFEEPEEKDEEEEEEEEEDEEEVAKVSADFFCKYRSGLVSPSSTRGSWRLIPQGELLSSS